MEFDTTAVPVITKQELAEQVESSDKCLVTLHHRKVYDVTPFLDEHPGGDSLILAYKGMDITEALKDPMSHLHSETCYEMLDEMYLVALLATDEEAKKILTDENRTSFQLQGGSSAQGSSTGIDSKTLTGDAEKELHIKTDFNADYVKHKFIDLNKPLLMQVVFAKYDKEFYLAQIHKPRHYGKGSAPIFGNFMEPLSKTPWWVVPLVWVPVNMYCVSIALRGLPAYVVAPLYVFGLGLWTLIEYLMHRFIFHIEKLLPDHPLAFALHFLLHGVHHYLPMDRMRLVMPPSLFVILCYPIYKLCFFLFPQYYVAMSIFAGGFMGYICYDVTHYSLHHKKLPEFMKEVKKHHLDHHYKNYDLGYGVTSKFWDSVFGTSMSDDVPSRLLKSYK